MRTSIHSSGKTEIYHPFLWLSKRTNPIIKNFGISRHGCKVSSVMNQWMDGTWLEDELH
jgi:hypothetical protein